MKVQQLKPKNNNDIAQFQFHHFDQGLEILKYTLELIKEGNEKIQADDKNIILVCGDTGSGKSTIINYLTGANLIAVKPANSKKYFLELEQGVNGVKIGHGNVSETLIPTKVKDPTNSSLIYWDCPGFEDTRGAAIDIANAFYINKLFKTTENLKTMVIIDETSINGARRGQAFKELIVRLSDLFVNKEELIKNICLVFTKVAFIEDFRTELKSLSNEITTSLSTDQITVLTAIIDRAPIAVFPLPFSAGNISSDTKDQILEAIEQVQYIKQPEVNINVSTNSLIALQSLVRIVNKEIGSNIKHISEILVNNVNNIPLESLEKIKTNLTVLHKNNFVNDNETLNFIENIIKQICEFDNTHKLITEIDVKLKEVKDLVGYFENFFCKILPSASIDQAKLKGPFLVSIFYSIEGAILKEVYKNNEEKLTIVLDNLQKSKESHELELQSRAEKFENMLKSKEQEMAIIVDQLKAEQEENKNYRVNIEELLKRQDENMALMKSESQLAQNKINELLVNNNSANEQQNKLMVDLTNKIIEIQNNPPSVTYVTNVYEDDWTCLIM